MKALRPVILFISLSMAGNAFALSTKNIIAYPVPFNPKTASNKFITVKDNAGSTYSQFTIEVFDINGDRVREISGSGTEVKWNGRNERGSLVKPGLYIIKVTVEDDTSGGYGKKLIRVLVSY